MCSKVKELLLPGLEPGFLQTKKRVTSALTVNSMFHDGDQT